MEEQICWYFGLIHVHFGVSIEWGDLLCTWFTCGSLIKQVNQYILSLAQVNTTYLHVITCITYWTLRRARERERERERVPLNFHVVNKWNLKNHYIVARKKEYKEKQKINTQEGNRKQPSSCQWPSTYPDIFPQETSTDLEKYLR